MTFFILVLILEHLPKTLNSTSWSISAEKIARAVSNYLHHCSVEFSMTYQVVIISVYFGHDLLPDLIITIFECCLTYSTMEDSS